MIWSLIALIVCFGSIFILAPMLRKMNIIDVPNGRSSHTQSTVRGAGLGPLLGITITSALALLGVTGMEWTQRAVLLCFMTTVIAFGALGFLEDWRGLRVTVRAGLQILIGVLGVIGLVIGSGGPLWLVPVGGVFVAGYVNTANFMDGVNGISGFHAIVVGGLYGLLGLESHLPSIAFGGLVIAASFAGFLPWNLAGRRVFLGDVGSYVLGGGIAILGVAAFLMGLPALAVLGPVSIYISDVTVTLCRRIARGERWYEAHRTHAYQRLTDCGYGHLASASLVALFSLVTGLAGMTALLGPWQALLGLLGMLAVVGLYLLLPRILGGRTETEGPKELLDAYEVRGTPGDVSASTWGVVGASGFVGRNVVSCLRAAGAKVVELRAPRLVVDPSAADPQSLTCEAESADAAYRELIDALSGCHVVVNAAGVAEPDAPESPRLFGANALLPIVIARAAASTGARRLVHLSSAAVQGSSRVLDESPRVAPFSPYSRSKALGEQALSAWRTVDGSRLRVTTVRATSVQGAGRPTTQRLIRLAQQPFASVASPGTQPSPISSVSGLAKLVAFVGAYDGPVPAIVLQPWEGMTARSTLELAGGRAPIRLPGWFCRSVVALGYFGANAIGGRLLGHVRRVELMWFGQAQRPGWAEDAGMPPVHHVADLFQAQRDTSRVGIARGQASRSGDLSS